MLLYLFEKEASPPLDAGGQPVERCHDRITFLIAELQRKKATLIVPTPALAELLVHAGDAAPQWLTTLKTAKHIKIASFDAIAAVEAAQMAKQRASRTAATGAIKQKAKFDEQIVAIAIVEQADEILSDDGHVARLVGDRMTVRGITDLPLPPEDRQIAIDFSVGERGRRALNLEVDEQDQ